MVQGLVDQVQEFPGAALVFGEVHGGVGKVEGAAGIAAEGDHLGVGSQGALAVGAVVRCVEAAQLTHRAEEPGKFLGLRVHTGRVGQPGAHAEGAFFHRRADDVLHVLLLPGRGVSFSETHHHGPDGPLGYEVGGVGGDAAALFYAVEAVEVLAHGPPVPVEAGRVVVPARDFLPDTGQCGVVHGRIGQSVLAQQFRGDALAELGVVVPVDQQLQVGMRVHVDETGTQDQAGGIDDTLGARVRCGEATGVDDGGNHRAVQQDVRLAAVRSGSVHQGGIADEGLHGGS
ncbi:hypothetical protein PJL18_03975 [Paenarthrobacter nicotinovorans]|nr:hypothetical protein [Paenarthrobacter nicotinovorans]